MGDNSFLWHVRAGTEQLGAGRVLTRDPFSFTAGGESWRTQSWFVELGYGWLEQTTGSLQWVPAMMFILMVAVLVFTGLAAYRVVRTPERTGLILIAVVWIAMSFVVPRPVIVSFLLLAVFVVVLASPDRLSWTLIPLTWLWAAVHGLFVVGLALVALEAVRRRSWGLGGIGVVAGVATLLTAHGFGIVGILIEFLENRDALGYLSEWKRPDFLSPALIPAVFLLGGLIFAFAKRRLSPGYLIVAAPFVVLGALQLRSVFPSIVVLVPLTAGAFPKRDRLVRPPTGNPRLNAAIALLIVIAALASLVRPLTRDTRTLPSAGAVGALSGSEVFHGPGAGGFLIWEEYPERRVFVDDRAELYGSEMFGDLVSTINGQTGFEMLDRFGLEEALVRTSWPLEDLLAAAVWTETYRDDRWAVYVRS